MASRFLWGRFLWGRFLWGRSASGRRGRSASGRRGRRIGLLATAIGLAWASGAAAGPGWTVEPSPSPSATGQSFLDGVSCSPSVIVLSATTCVAVGSYITDKGVERPLVEKWDGATWRVVPGQPNDRSLASALVAVSCAKATSCLAVGTTRATVKSFTLPLTQRWDGTRWKVLPSRAPGGAGGTYLNAVSCVTTTSCYAVGNYATGFSAGLSLVEHWNGSKWTIMESPNPKRATSTTLTGVSCVATTCWAVGSYTTKPVGEPFFTVTEQLQRGKWALVGSPNANGDQSSALNAVSCSRVASCYAVGVWNRGSGAALVEHWNGARWSVVSTGSGTGAFSRLSGVSCGTLSCVATGTNTSTLIVRGSLTRWTIEPAASPAGAQSSSLAGVSCVGPANCVSVGSYTSKSTGITTGFAEHRA